MLAGESPNFYNLYLFHPLFVNGFQIEKSLKYLSYFSIIYVLSCRSKKNLIVRFKNETYEMKLQLDISVNNKEAS